MSIKLRNLRQLIGRTLPPEFDPLLAFASSTREINLIISCAMVAKTMVEKAKAVALPTPPPLPTIDDSVRVRITSIGANKIGAIKSVRNFSCLGLKEAKDICDVVSNGTPQIIGPMSLVRARQFEAEMSQIASSTAII